MRAAAALAALGLVLLTCAKGLTLGSPDRLARPHRKQHMQNKGLEIYAMYRSRLNLQPDAPRKVIFACDASSSLCGGLGDRFKGLVSTFVLALLLNAEFHAFWESPVPLREFFTVGIGSLLDGAGVLLDTSEYLALSNNASVFNYFNAHVHASEMHRLRTLDFEALFAGKKALVVRCNGAVWNHLILSTQLWQAAEHFSLQKLSKRQVFEVVMTLFFSQPTCKLSAAVADATTQLTGLRIGVQMRLGGPNVSDPARYSGSLESTVACFALETLGACGSNCSVFLTTDSADAQAAFLSVMQSHGVTAVTVPGEILHLENSRNSSSQHLKTFADWFILTKMNMHISSRSGFSETAAWFGNVHARALVRTSTCLFTDSVELPDGADV